MARLMMNASVSARIAILCLIPMLALMGVGISKVWDLHRASGVAAEVVEIVRLAPAVSGLVHELQKERGSSAGFVGSKGKSFADAAPARRAETDAALTRFRAEIDAHPKVLANPVLSRPLGRAELSLKQLADKRRQIDAFSIAVPEVAAYYTPLIADLLAMVEAVAGAGEYGRLVQSVIAYSALLQGKERAGQERAFGSAGFSAGQFPQQVYTNFVQLGAIQDTYFAVFEKFANEEQKTILREALGSASGEQVATYRKRAYGAPFDGNLDGLSGPQWFDVSTKRIDAIKQVEDRVASDIVGYAVSLMDSSTVTFWYLTAFLLGLLALTVVVTVAVARSIVVPMRRLADAMRRVSRNETSIDIIDRHRKDEIGEMAGAVDIFRENAIERIRLERSAQIERDKERRRQSHVESLIGRFRGALANMLASVDQQAGKMQATAGKLNDVSRLASKEMGAAGQASSGASGDVRSVSEATEELAQSIREIATQTSRATMLVSAAAETAASTDRDVSSLSAAAEQIGNIVSLIRNIAEQTNLLALNATIEAARAGEMGKGFAVVAAEVKSLATQTARATEDIGQQITGIQGSTKTAVNSIRQISSAVDEINQVTASIASAVEEQQASTQEIAKSLQSAFQGTDLVAQSLGNVTSTVNETTREAETVQEVSENLTTATGELSSFIEKFLVEVGTDMEERRNALRTKMSETIVISKSGRRMTSTMLDVSETGARIALVVGMKVGDVIDLELADGRTISGTIVRLHDTNAGVRFTSSLPEFNWMRQAA